MKVLIVASYYDHPSDVVSTFLGDVVPVIKSYGHEVVELVHEQANYENFSEAMEKFNPDLVLASGHGFENLFTGDKGQDLLWCEGASEQYDGKERFNSNVGITKGKTIYLISCLCGKILGKRIAQEGGNFIGYDDDYFVACEEDEGFCYDSFLQIEALICLELAQQTPLFLIKEKVMRKYDELIQEIKNVSHPQSDLILLTLMHNRNHTVFYEAEHE